jgi:hypothetical protein
MINQLQNISAENPSAEVWKHLRFFLDVQTTANRIRRLQGIAEDTQRRNIEKQAHQIAFCIRQAEQYFTASSHVGLATRPVLLYYGAMHLSQALILLKKDGTHSLDARRKAYRHNHHGLDLNRGKAEGAATATNAQDFLKFIECSCHIHEEKPWGHFPLFVDSLVPTAFTIHCGIFLVGKQSFLERDIPMNSLDPMPVAKLASRTLNALELIKGLPDLYFSLFQMGVVPDLCRGSIKREIQYSSSGQPRPAIEGSASAAVPPPFDHVVYADKFFLDGILPAQKAELVSLYKARNPKITIVDDHGANLYLTLQAEGTHDQAVFQQLGYYPDVIEDLAGKKYYIIRPDQYVPEPAALLALLFCLSMLSRYYPDIWMRNIDKNVRMAELMNELLNIVFRKFPNLILDQLTLVKYNIRP